MGKGYRTSIEEVKGKGFKVSINNIIDIVTFLSTVILVGIVLLVVLMGWKK